MTPVVSVPSNVPFLAKIIGHGSIWIIGVVGLCLASHQFRQRLRDRAVVETALRQWGRPRCQRSAIRP